MDEQAPLNEAPALKKKTATMPRWRIVLICLIALGVTSGVSSVTGIAMIEHTSTVKFCGSCHEMDPFIESWREASHGIGAKGSMHARCVDCHLPAAEDGIFTYLVAKGKSGANDAYVHLTTGGEGIDWYERLDHAEVYTFESGCRKCHEELVAPGISLKAFRAHRDYQLGQTEKTCVECHTDVGHGDTRGMIQREFPELQSKGERDNEEE